MAVGGSGNIFILFERMLKFLRSGKDQVSQIQQLQLHLVSVYCFRHLDLSIYHPGSEQRRGLMQSKFASHVFDNLQVLTNHFIPGVALQCRLCRICLGKDTLFLTGIYLMTPYFKAHDYLPITR